MTHDEIAQTAYAAVSELRNVLGLSDQPAWSALDADQQEHYIDCVRVRDERRKINVDIPPSFGDSLIEYAENHLRVSVERSLLTTNLTIQKAVPVVPELPPAPIITAPEKDPSVDIQSVPVGISEEPKGEVSDPYEGLAQAIAGSQPGSGQEEAKQ